MKPEAAKPQQLRLVLSVNSNGHLVLLDAGTGEPWPAKQTSLTITDRIKQPTRVHVEYRVVDRILGTEVRRTQAFEFDIARGSLSETFACEVDPATFREVPADPA